MTTGLFILIAVFGALYAIFLVWYGGKGKPMSPEEVEDRLADMLARAGKGAEVSPILDNFRELARNDDGREYHMVNLMRFRDKALYPPGSPSDDDAMAANARYNRVIVPALLKHGGFPVYLGAVQGRFIHPDAADDWDQIGIVRYRSRRDMLKMAADLAGSGADIHKWAALEKTHVFPVKPLVNLVFVRVSVAVVLGLMAALMYVLF